VVRRLLPILVAALALSAVGAPAAFGHALLTGTSPERGAELKRGPDKVEFDFSEPVETNFGSVRVFDAAGKRVDRGKAEHPGGAGDRLSVALRPTLADGTYTATYRVISADSHPVSGGFTFSVGTGGPAPAKDVSDLLAADGDAGEVTQVAFGAARALGYLAIALFAGGGLFLLAVWAPARRGLPGGEEWLAADGAFAPAARRIAALAAALGIASTAAGIVLQGATAAGTSFWDAVDPAVIGDVLGTRFGTVWALRLAAWVVAAGVVLAPRRGVEGTPRRAAPALVGAVLVLTPALAGHASTHGSRGVLIVSTIVHVAAMSVWLGGLAALIAAVPAATRKLQPPDRTRLLSALLARFSPLALGAVIALLSTGVLQSILYLDALAELTSTAFGRALLIKAGLLLVLVCLGAHNRRRSLPRLAALARDGEAPGGAGVVLRRALRTEVAVIVVVLGVTAALASYSPTATATAGPFSAQRELGPIELELTVDPARTGRNEVHLYLFRRKDGSQFDGAKELTVSASLPDRKIGPLTLDARKSGPGHYTVPSADLAPAGDWRLRTTVRVSAFDEYESAVEVPVE
jgi:copper transport protein